MQGLKLRITYLLKLNHLNFNHGMKNIH